MSTPSYKVGDVIDLVEDLPSYVDLYGQGRTNRKIVKVTEDTWSGNFLVTLEGDPETWSINWIAGLSKGLAIAVEDRVKFRFTKKTGTVVSAIEHGVHAGKVLVEWDKEELPTAEETRNLIVLHSPTATVEVDEELVAHLNDERQRLLRIIEAATKELRPITKKWEEAKAGRVVDTKKEGV